MKNENKVIFGLLIAIVGSQFGLWLYGTFNMVICSTISSVITAFGIWMVMQNHSKKIPIEVGRAYKLMGITNVLRNKEDVYFITLLYNDNYGVVNIHTFEILNFKDNITEKNIGESFIPYYSKTDEKSLTFVKVI